MRPPRGGSIAASGDRSSAVPTWTAVAPSVIAAATLRPSAIAPVAMIGMSRWSANRGEQGEEPTLMRSAASGSKLRDGRRFHALGDDRVGAGFLGGERVVESGGAGEPGGALVVQALDEVGREQSHDRGDDGGVRREHGLGLLCEVRTRGAGPRRSAEPVQERGGGVDRGRVVARLVRDPDVELQRSGRRGAKPSCPLGDLVRMVEYDPGGAHAAGPGDRRPRVRVGRRRHRCLQNR